MTVTAPTDVICPDGAVTIKAQIKNSGPGIIFYAANNVTVTVDVTGPLPLLPQSISTTISSGFTGSGGLKLVTLIGTIDMSVVGDYSFVLSTTFGGDTDPSNDILNTIVVTVEEPQINDLTNPVCSGSMFTTTPVDVIDGSVPAGTTYTWT